MRYDGESLETDLERTLVTTMWFFGHSRLKTTSWASSKILTLNEACRHVFQVRRAF